MTTLALGFWAGIGGAITIDGDFNDWTNAVTYEIPAESKARTGSVFGQVEKLWVAHDDEFLYFRLDFARARPFSDDTQSAWQTNYWANMRYILLDVDGDSQPDYYTNQIRHKQAGFNRTYLVKYTEDKQTTYLWYEGHPDWNSGPRGHYSADGKQIEFRVPIEPLNLENRTIGIRVQMNLRDGLEGSNRWTNDLYPSPDDFFLYNLDSGAKVQSKGRGAPLIVRMIETDVAPEIDGKLNDAAWTDKPVLHDFRLNRGSLRPVAQTRARLTYDHDNLYIAVYAQEPEMDNIVVDATPAESGRVFGDDVIELFVDYHNDDKTYLHMGVTAKGVTCGQWGVKRGARGAGGINFDIDAEVAYQHHNNGWSLEIALPFSTLGTRPAAGEVWGLNICRGRPNGREYSSWAGVQGAFAQPRQFGDAVFPSETGLSIASRGMAAPEGNADQSNALSGTFKARDDTTINVHVTARVGPKETFSAGRQFPAVAGRTITFSLPYVVAGEEDELIAFKISAGGETLYENSVPVIIRTDYPRVWQTKDPLYAELLGDSAPGMGAEGVIFWAHDIVDYNLGVFCLKHAQPYILEESYKNAGRHKLRYIAGIDLTVGDSLLAKNVFKMQDYSKKYGVKLVSMGNTRAKAEGKPHNSNGNGFLVDPDNQEVYLQLVKEFVTQWQEYLWAFMTGDEVQDYDLMRGLEFHYDDDPYPFMEQVDKEVKEEFGYGKYGIPTSLNDKNPFRWIAYRRWYNDRFAKFQERIQETVREIAPHLRVIGPDPMGQVQPFDYSGYGRYTDIMTSQTYPRGRYEQDAAWITKTLSDLSGKPTMPCVHVENYAGSFRPDEVREIMSQVYRGGGAGFHLYMPDTTGARTPHNMVLDKYGSWPRWETVMGTVDNAANNNRPKLPVAKAAVLYSNDAYMGEYLGEPRGADQYRWMFNFFGPAVRGWFQVISDNQIGRAEIELGHFDVIYVPQAYYQRREIVEALAAYVEAGGKLVVTQPEAFTYHLDGREMTDLRSKLLLPAGEPAQHKSVKSVGQRPIIGDFRQELQVLGKAAALQLADGAEAILRYEDDSVAAARKPLGSGAVYCFGFEPMYQKNLASEAWRSYWKAFHAGLGQQVDLDIWRFTFPPIEAADIQPPAGKCLTNNYVIWDTNEMIPVSNLELDGKYSYSVAPDYGKDQGGTTDISFAKGDLVDRRTALDLKDGNYSHELAHFAVGWKTTQAVTITFDLASAYELDRIWLLFTGQLPDTVVEGIVNGKWQELGQLARQTIVDHGDFPAVTIELDKQAPAVQQLRINLGERDENQRLIVPELEIWARE